MNRNVVKGSPVCSRISEVEIDNIQHEAIILASAQSTAFYENVIILTESCPRLFDNRAKNRGIVMWNFFKSIISMKNMGLIFIGFLFCGTNVMALDPAGYREMTSWMDDYCLIRLHPGANPVAARDSIESAGGRVAIIASKDVLLGWIKPSIESRICGHAGVAAVERQIVPIDSFRSLESKQGATAFNWIKSGSAIDEMLITADRQGEPLTLDAFVQPRAGADPFEKIPTGSLMGQLPPLDRAGCGNSESMTGVVAVTMFFVESNGAGTDPNTYTWTLQHQADTYNRAVSGLSWWSSRAPEYGAGVTFNIIIKSASDPVCQVPYEPVLHTTSEDSLWINRIMQNIGASTVNSYNSSVRSSTGADWSYSIFVAYNPGSEHTFKDGYFAYAYLGGPYTQLCYCNDGWGAGNFAQVLAHETAHIFWADDEYYQAGYGGCTSCGTYGNCPRPNSIDGNCQSCNQNSVSCIMRDGSIAAGLCSYTPSHIGWTGSGSTNHAPTANAGADKSVVVTSHVSLDGSGSNDMDGQPITYNWQQMSGIAVALSGNTTAKPSFVAPSSPGTLVFRLIVSDGSLAGTDDVSIAVTSNGGDHNRAPVADAGPDQSVSPGSFVKLNGAWSYDPDNNAISYQWVQISGPTVELFSATTAFPTFWAPTVSAVLAFRLIVSDGSLISSDDAQVAIGSGEDTPSISLITSKTGKPGGAATIYGNGFSSNSKIVEVRFGGQRAKISKAKPDSIKITIPQRLSRRATVDVSVSVNGNSSNIVPFTLN